MRAWSMDACCHALPTTQPCITKHHNQLFNAHTINCLRAFGAAGGGGDQEQDSVQDAAHSTHFQTSGAHMSMKMGAKFSRGAGAVDSG